jgi:hypothetical protein
MSGCNSRQPHHFRSEGYSPLTSAHSDIQVLKSRTSLCSRVSKTQLAWGSTRATCQYSWGCGRKVMHLPCKQAQAGALPAASTISSRETRPKHREEPHKLLEVGLTPTPATILRTMSYGWQATAISREVIRLPDCKSGVIKQAESDELERYQHFPPFWIRSSIRGATRCLRKG